MQQLFQKFHETVKQVTKPNAKLHPDPLVYQFTWNRNVTNLYIIVLYAMLVLSAHFLLMAQYFSFWMNCYTVLFHVYVLISYLTFCRSYQRVFNLIHTINVTIYALIGFDVLPDTVYTYIGYIFMTNVCIILLTGDVWMALFVGSVNFLVFLTNFKSKLEILILDEEPEIFADKLVKNTAIFLGLMLLKIVCLVAALDKRTIELLRVKNDLEKALEQQKTFIFSFSHELRNPINSLLGNLQLVLQGEALSVKAVEMINVAKVCGEILLHNINNVLDIGKYEIGKLEVQPVSTQLHELFQRTWSIYAEPLRQKRLRSQLNP